MTVWCKLISGFHQQITTGIPTIKAFLHASNAICQKQIFGPLCPSNLGGEVGIGGQQGENLVHLLVHRSKWEVRFHVLAAKVRGKLHKWQSFSLLMVRKKKRTQWKCRLTFPLKHPTKGDNGTSWSFPEGDMSVPVTSLHWLLVSKILKEIRRCPVHKGLKWQLWSYQRRMIRTQKTEMVSIKK